MHLYVSFQTMNNIHCNRIKQPKIYTAQMDMTSEMHWRRPGSTDRPDQKIAVDWKVQTNASRNQATGLQSLLYYFQKKSLVGSVDIILTSNCFAETESDLWWIWSNPNLTQTRKNRLLLPSTRKKSSSRSDQWSLHVSIPPHENRLYLGLCTILTRKTDVHQIEWSSTFSRVCLHSS